MQTPTYGGRSSSEGSDSSPRPYSPPTQPLGEESRNDVRGIDVAQRDHSDLNDVTIPPNHPWGNTEDLTWLNAAVRRLESRHMSTDAFSVLRELGKMADSRPPYVIRPSTAAERSPQGSVFRRLARGHETLPAEFFCEKTAKRRGGVLAKTAQRCLGGAA